MNELGETIRSKREGIGMPLRPFAHRIGLSTTYVSRLERGHAGVTASERTLNRIADTLDLDRDTLYCLAGKIPASLKRDILQSTTHMQAVRVALSHVGLA